MTYEIVRKQLRSLKKDPQCDIIQGLSFRKKKEPDKLKASKTRKSAKKASKT